MHTAAGLLAFSRDAAAGDLHSATVFVSILGNDTQQAKGLALLNQQQKRIQGLVAHAVILKYTPHLKFVLDDSIARGNRVLGILKELEQSTPDA